MTLYKYYTYFDAHLLHGCTRAHQGLLPSYPALPLQFRSRCPVAQPMSRFNIQVLYLFRFPSTSWLHASSPRTTSIVSCAAFAVSQSMPSCSTDVSLRHTSTMPRVYTVHTLTWPNQPMHQAPLRRLQTTSYHTKIPAIGHLQTPTLERVLL